MNTVLSALGALHRNMIQLLLLRLPCVGSVPCAALNRFVGRTSRNLSRIDALCHTSPHPFRRVAPPAGCRPSSFACGTVRKCAASHPNSLQKNAHTGRLAPMPSQRRVNSYGSDLHPVHLPASPLSRSSRATRLRPVSYCPAQPASAVSDHRPGRPARRSRDQLPGARPRHPHRSHRSHRHHHGPA